MVTVGENGLAFRVQVLAEVVCVSRSANTLGKGMNPTVLSPAMDK